FFPLYPLAVRAMAPLFGGNLFWSAFAVSNLCTLLAALLMLKLGALRRRTDGVRAALLFLASPGAHFFAYPYSEALFALGLALGFVALRDGRLALAAGAGAAASATRSPGVAVALALVAQSPRRLRNVAAAAGAPSGGGAFPPGSHQRLGDALAFVHIQAYHKRHLELLGAAKAFLAFDQDPDYYLIAALGLFVAAMMIRRTPLWA